MRSRDQICLASRRWQFEYNARSSYDKGWLNMEVQIVLTAYVYWKYCSFIGWNHGPNSELDAAGRFKRLSPLRVLLYQFSTGFFAQWAWIDERTINIFQSSSRSSLLQFLKGNGKPWMLIKIRKAHIVWSGRKQIQSAHSDRSLKRYFNYLTNHQRRRLQALLMNTFVRIR